MEQVYEHRGEVPISVSNSAEIEQLEALRDGIARGAATLDVEINRLSDNIKKLDERMQDASVDITAMEVEYRTEYQRRVLDNIRERHEKEDKLKENTQVAEDMAQAMLSSARPRRALPQRLQRRGRPPIRGLPEFSLSEGGDPDTLHGPASEQDIPVNPSKDNLDVMMVTDDDFSKAVRGLSM